jgi:hypothetical protein
MTGYRDRGFLPIGTFFSKRLTCKKSGKKGSGPAQKLILGPERLVLREYRRNGFCGYGTPYQLGKFPAVVDMCDLETDDKPEAEAGDAD